MKFRILVIAQITALAASIIAGNILSSSLVDGPRVFHRTSGVMAGAFGIVVLVVALQRRFSRATQALALASIVLTFIAASAGSELEGAENYDQTYNVMRSAGIFALATSVVTLMMSSRETKEEPQKKSEDSQ